MQALTSNDDACSTGGGSCVVRRALATLRRKMRAVTFNGIR